MEWVSFDEIKKTVTLQMALDRYGIRLRRVNEQTLRGKCPLPSHRSERSGDSFTATLNKGVGGAWACQSQSCRETRGRAGGNVLDFVAAMEQCSVRDAAVKLQSWFLTAGVPNSAEGDSKEPHQPISRDKEPETLTAENASEVIVANKPLSFELQHVDHTHPYLAERGITEATARMFGVGVFNGKGSMHGRCVIPIHNRDGQLVAYAGRSIDGSEPRYKFPAGFHKSLELYNLHRVKGELSVVLVEGFFDCMKVTQAGFPCVALMGSAMSEVQEDFLVDHFADIAVMLDGDDAGTLAASQITDRLQRRVYHLRNIALLEDVQPDQLSDAQLQEQLGCL